MIGSIIVNFLLSKLIRSFDKRIKKIWLILGVAFNIGVIFCFKYYDFFISNLNYVFQTNFNLKHILLPLGISFFTFQQLSYIIDSYTGKIKAGGVSVS
jgi:D-alanyl-lipoteichoic acid acyltransferase DltB (MBOAT superfamily)